MDMHPLDPLPGEQSYRAPAAIRKAVQARYESDPFLRHGNGSAFARAFAEHVMGGEPIGLSTVERLHEFLSETGGEEAARKAVGAGQHVAATRELFGGDIAAEWARAVLIKAGKLDPDREGEAFRMDVEIFKVDESLGLIFGWAIVCTENGLPYYDTQDDHIPEPSMLKAASEFMAHSRVLGDMHKQAEGGSVVFCFPMTAEIASAYGMTTAKTGLMIGVKPANDETLQKFRSGEYTGFSIGGRRLVDEETE